MPGVPTGQQGSHHPSQASSHSTAGSVQTLKWAEFDAHKHTARMQVFGGAFTGRGATGVWTEPNKCTWNCLINLARCFNYTYFFEFSPDWRKADIKIQSNCPFGCCCLWCGMIFVGVPVPVCATHLFAVSYCIAQLAFVVFE